MDICVDLQQQGMVKRTTVWFISRLIQADSGIHPSSYMMCMDETHWKKERHYVCAKDQAQLTAGSSCCQELPTQHLKVIDHTLLNIILSVTWPQRLIWEVEEQ